jgi:hypothetical protein
MRFCRKCGFEVGTWMSFCPKCGAVLAQVTTQPRRYGYRVTSFLVPNALLWFLLGFLWVIRFNAYGDLTWYSQFMLLAFGTVAGLVVGVALTQKQLSTLTKKGELGSSLSSLLFMMGGVLIFGAFFLAAMLASPSLAGVIHAVVIDSILGAGIGIIAARVFLLINWERNHKMRLYQKGWITKIYAVPTSDSRSGQ